MNSLHILRLAYVAKEKIEEIYDVWYIYDQIEDQDCAGSG